MNSKISVLLSKVYLSNLLKVPHQNYMLVHKKKMYFLEQMTILV